MGFKSPRAEIPSRKWLFLSNLRSKMFGQIQNLAPHRVMSRLKSKTTPGDTLPARPYPIDAWNQKMDVDGDGGRRGSGLRGQPSWNRQASLSSARQIRQEFGDGRARFHSFSHPFLGTACSSITNVTAVTLRCFPLSSD